MTEFPIGAHYDEERRIALTGHQRGNGVGILFGVVGVLAADSLNKSAGGSIYEKGGMETRTVDLLENLNAEIERKLSEPEFASLLLDASQPRPVEVRPTGLLVVDKAGLARLYVILKTAQKGPDSLKNRWHGRYIASASSDRPLEGEEGWGSGSHLSDGLAEALSASVWAMMGDVGGVFTEGRTVKVSGRFAWLPFELKGLAGAVLAEREDATVVRLYIADVNVMSGTHVFRKGEVLIESAKVKDPRPKAAL